jgi:hypothetical protein
MTRFAVFDFHCNSVPVKLMKENHILSHIGGVDNFEQVRRGSLSLCFA